MPIMAKCTGSMPTDRASGSRIVPTMMIAGMASRKQPTTRNTKAMKKPVAIAHAPGGDAGEDRPGDLVVGEQPAERARRADAEQRDGGELAGVEQRVLQALQVHLAVDEERQRAGVEHGDAGRLGRREPAEDLAADDDHGVVSAGTETSERRRSAPQGGARIGRIAARLGIGVHGRHLHEADQEPGTMPARNSAPIETVRMPPQTIIRIEAG